MSSQQDWNPKQYADHARFVTDLGAPLIALLVPKAGERILDMGCGDGILTKQLMDIGCEVLGVDASPAMVEAARTLGVQAQVMDGHALPFHEQFDAVFSNAALHWMLEPDEVLRRIWSALRPGGRFVAEFGGQGNLTHVLTGLHQVLKDHGYDPDSIRPWYFPSAEEYRERLTQTRFRGALSGPLSSSDAIAERHDGLVGDVCATLSDHGSGRREETSLARGAGIAHSFLESRRRPVGR